MTTKTTNKVENVQPLRTASEISEMREAIAMSPTQSERNVLLFNIGINTGLRIGDIVQLRIEDVRGRTNFRILEGKTKKPRTVDISMLMVEIADYLEDKDAATGWLFPSRRGDSHISTTQAYRILTAAADILGRDDIGTHSMRKTFGYHAYKMSRDVAMLMEIFNHSDQATTKRYIGIRDEEIAHSLQGFKL